MINVNEYLPIGSVVLLSGGTRKAMITGIMQRSQKDDNVIEEYDYIGVGYPEGFLNVQTMVLFNHSQINDVVFKGYENPERTKLLEIIQKAENLN